MELGDILSAGICRDDRLYGGANRPNGDGVLGVFVGDIQELLRELVELPGNRSTTAAPSKPGPDPGPVYLQNHGCPLRYRNIWVVEKG